MRKNIKLLVFMLALAMQSIPTWSATDSVYPVALNYVPTGRLGNNPKPSKAPAKFNLSLSVSLNLENQQLVMQDSYGEVYTYYILNKNEEVVSQGILDFSSTENHIVDLWNYHSGAYTLAIVYGGHTFFGTFDID